MKPDTPKTKPRIAIVGEAPGNDEEKAGRPFVGMSGQELNRQLSQVGIIREDCYVTNLIWERPYKNKLENFCTTVTKARKEYKDEHRDRLRAAYPDYDWPDTYTFSPIIGKKYLQPSRLDCLPRLQQELASQSPVVVLAVGNAACWALIGQTGVGNLRGVVAASVLGDYKVIPIYHPAAVLRQYSLRSTTILDLKKAKRESEFREIKTPPFEIWIEPNLADLGEFRRQYLDRAESISIDIETGKSQITCVGFGCTVDGIERALVIPFVDRRKPDNSYWPSKAAERWAWEFVKEICGNDKPKELQNGLYDQQYLYKFSCPVRNAVRDTMLLHHSMQPELPKGLGFLASVYTDFPSWKDMRPKGKQFESLKKEA